jgi:hypothetical protein
MHVPKLPSDWESRATIRELERGDGHTVEVLYLDVYDLLTTKLFANRPQDEAFLRGVAELQQLDANLLAMRIASVPLKQDQEFRRGQALNTVRRVFAHA